ncbi:diguanylate cyclase (GGDEF)-like protein [Rhodococcus sp. 27YEA15]|uniref:GGDEF domain-containing protein n=1 Tax=Rhodococcus sp. 27YEA15 TaxID=3156259 RepID=UPI003C7BE443
MIRREPIVVSGPGGAQRNSSSVRMWWRQPFEFDHRQRLLRERGLLGSTRMIVQIGLGFGFGFLILIQFVPDVVTTPVERVITVFGALGVSYCFRTWSDSRIGPSEGRSAEFLLITNAVIGMVLLAGVNSQLLATTGVVLYAVLSLYAALFHSPRMLAAQLTVAVAVGAVTTAAATPVLDSTGILIVLAVFVVTGVLFASSVVLHMALMHLSDDADQARVDPLTGLLNRRGLSEARAALIESRARGRSTFVVMVIDVDGFKDLNDVHGHGAGDAALSVVAERMAVEVGSDGLLARTGGDEFVAIVEATTDSATRVATRVHDAVHSPRDARPLTASTGVYDVCTELALFKDAEIFDLAIHRADTAMYRAKRQGGNRIAWTDTAWQ